MGKGLVSLVRLVAGADEEHLDAEIRRPDGTYVATRCGRCKGYRRDVLVTPFRRLLRGTALICSCPPADNRATQRLTDEELARATLAAMGAGG